MATDFELRQNINAAQRAAHYARGRRDALQHALNLVSGVQASSEVERVYRQLSTMLETARKEAAECAAELDAAYEAYDKSLNRTKRGLAYAARDSK